MSWSNVGYSATRLHIHECCWTQYCIMSWSNVRYSATRLHPRVLLVTTMYALGWEKNKCRCTLNISPFPRTKKHDVLLFPIISIKKKREKKKGSFWCNVNPVLQLYLRMLRNPAVHVVWLHQLNSAIRLHLGVLREL